MPRYFTLGEARAALPLVGRSMREALHAKAKNQDAERSLNRLTQRILMAGGIQVDTAQAESWKNQYDSSAAALKTALERIEEAGALVKDLDTGLVDFPTLFEGREVYLCWRVDESDIGHWHGVDEGFAGRRAIDRHFIDHHRGD
ncbi:MAG TPA: DUF2203 domain-containing protein [Bryobacteraceae bacterium]|nr:DUF2203 domain-containing protein [Bryobacteraceae bacterium]